MGTIILEQRKRNKDGKFIGKPKIRISSSIANFRDKLLQRTGLSEWRWNIFTPTIFFGMYHYGDYIRAILHLGPKKIFWCGADILNLPKHLWPLLIHKTKHYCENEVEQIELAKKGIYAQVLPMIFENFKSVDAYRHSKKPQVFITMHKGRKVEYGAGLVATIRKRCPDVTFHIYGIRGRNTENIIFHGHVTSDDFNKQILNYHAALRLNEFDGFAETLAKSVLLGQYPISRIAYPGIDTYTTEDELVVKLNELCTKTMPNPERIVWWARLENNLLKLIGDWR